MWENVLSRLLHDPVSVYLLAGSVLATIAVGLGIIWEHGPPDVQAAANRFVIGGIIVETLCTVLLFAYDANIIGAQNDIIISMEARPWTKAQFDAIQEIKGKVTDVGVVPEKNCLECQIFAEHIELALHIAGVQLYGDDTSGTLGDVMRGTGIFVRFPAGTNMESDPLLGALKKAGLNPAFGIHSPGFIIPIRTDIPVIFVGEKGTPYPEFPYFPPGGTSWTVLPLKKSTP